MVTGMPRKAGKDDWFDPAVPLLASAEFLRSTALQTSCSENRADPVELEQANVFSAMVGIFGTKALDSVSNGEKTGQRPWAIQLHYDPGGWYIVWR
jgi:hypothetical protein